MLIPLVITYIIYISFGLDTLVSPCIMMRFQGMLKNIQRLARRSAEIAREIPEDEYIRSGILSAYNGAILAVPTTTIWLIQNKEIVSEFCTHSGDALKENGLTLQDFLLRTYASAERHASMGTTYLRSRTNACVPLHYQSKVKFGHSLNWDLRPKTRPNLETVRNYKYIRDHLKEIEPEAFDIIKSNDIRSIQERSKLI